MGGVGRAGRARMHQIRYARWAAGRFHGQGNIRPGHTGRAHGRRQPGSRVEPGGWTALEDAHRGGERGAGDYLAGNIPAVQYYRPTDRRRNSNPADLPTNKAAAAGGERPVALFGGGQPPPVRPGPPAIRPLKPCPSNTGKPAGRPSVVLPPSVRPRGWRVQAGGRARASRWIDTRAANRRRACVCGRGDFKTRLYLRSNSLSDHSACVCVCVPPRRAAWPVYIPHTTPRRSG